MGKHTQNHQIGGNEPIKLDEPVQDIISGKAMGILG
jgi:hypothetical protein